MEGANQFEAGPVADVGQAGEAVAAEVTLEDPAVGRAVEECAPCLELVDAVGRLLGVQLGHAPVVEHLAAAHRVAEVNLPVVLGVDVAHGRRDATLGHDRMRFAEQGLADERGAQTAGLGLDGRPEAGTAGPDDDHVVIVGFVLGHLDLPRRSWGR